MIYKQLESQLRKWTHESTIRKSNFGGRTSSKREESLVPPLPTERDVKQPAITSFFMKSQVKKETKKDTRKPRPKEQGGKKKVTDMTAKQDMRKLLSRKSTTTTPSSPMLYSPPKCIEGDALVQAKTTVEVETKEESTKKYKAQKQAAEIKGKDISKIHSKRSEVKERRK